MVRLIEIEIREMVARGWLMRNRSWSKRKFQTGSEELMDSVATVVRMTTECAVLSPSKVKINQKEGKKKTTNYV